MSVLISVFNKPNKPESVTPLWLAQASVEASKSAPVSVDNLIIIIIQRSPQKHTSNSALFQTPVPSNNSEPNLLQQLQQLQNLILNKQQQEASKAEQV